MMLTPLGRALIAHRAMPAHPRCKLPACDPGCCRHCAAYLDIARRHTAARQILAGTTAPHTRLDIREGTAT